MRCTEQLRALKSLQDHRSSLAVALPGAESRALQSRAQDARLVQKLCSRVAALMCDLDFDEPIAQDSSQYQQGLAALRDEQLRKAQADIERDVALLGNILQERQQSGSASSLTRSQQNRAKRKRKRIRQLVDSMAAWQQLDLPDSSTVQQLPTSWTEQVVKNLFKGVFPWKRLPDSDVPAVMAERFREACAEVRCMLYIPLVCLTLTASQPLHSVCGMTTARYSCNNQSIITSASQYRCIGYTML